MISQEPEKPQFRLVFNQEAAQGFYQAVQHGLTGVPQENNKALMDHMTHHIDGAMDDGLPGLHSQHYSHAVVTAATPIENGGLLCDVWMDEAGIAHLQTWAQRERVSPRTKISGAIDHYFRQIESSWRRNPKAAISGVEQIAP